MMPSAPPCRIWIAAAILTVLNFRKCNRANAGSQTDGAGSSVLCGLPYGCREEWWVVTATLRRRSVQPSLAAMLLSKLRNGAMGAAGLKVPDTATREAWTAATIEQAEGATKWTVLRDSPNSISASIVRETARRKQNQDKPLYRLTISCNTANREGEMQLTWSPEPQVDRSFLVQTDSEPAVGHRLTGREQKMGNGAQATTGLASFVLPPALAKRTLTIRDLFSGETVVFPLSELDSTHRRELEPCFAVR
jgi:hypothetical protein